MEGISIKTREIGCDQIYITGIVEQPNTDVETSCFEMYRMVEEILTKHNLGIFHERVFGNLSFYDTIYDVRKKFRLFSEEPFTYIEGDTYWGGGVAGLQIHAVRQTDHSHKLVKIKLDNSVYGRMWQNHDTTYLSLQTIAQRKDNNSSRYKQTATVFDRINAILQNYNLSFNNVVRTWIYLSDILSWYDEFNQVRTEKFKEFRLVNNSLSNENIDTIYLPASTGISGNNPFDSWSAVDVLAVNRNKNSELLIYPLTQGNQKSAFRYGSAFSRGICLKNSAYKQLLVSGTAAIDASGKSLYKDDSEAQIRTTFEIVESLIKKEGAELNDICSATIFLKNREDIGIYRDVVKHLNLQDIPAVIVIADICRDELLFEIDAIAVVRDEVKPV